jgi:hypothetical protein
MTRKVNFFFTGICMTIAVVILFSCDNRNGVTNKNSLPAAPTQLYGIGISSSALILNWQDNSDNETGFTVYRDWPVWDIIATVGPNIDQYVDSLLQDSTSYRYYVAAFNSRGSSSTADTITVTTLSIGQPPDFPSNPIPYNGVDITVLDTLLRWDCSDPDGDSLRYDIYFGDTDPPNWAASDILVKSYNPGTFLINRTYFWKVTAKDTHKHKSDSPVWSFRTVSPNK